MGQAIIVSASVTKNANGSFDSIITDNEGNKYVNLHICTTERYATYLANNEIGKPADSLSFMCWAFDSTK